MGDRSWGELRARLGELTWPCHYLDVRSPCRALGTELAGGQQTAKVSDVMFSQ